VRSANLATAWLLVCIIIIIIFAAVVVFRTNCEHIGVNCVESCIGLTAIREVQLFTVHRWSTQLVKLSSVIILFGQTRWQLTSQVNK